MKIMKPESESICSCVRMKGLEPPRLSAPDPKSGAATNYATSAFCCYLKNEMYLSLSGLFKFGCKDTIFWN